MRTELAAALEGRAAALPPKAGLREYAALFRADDKPKAKARLDGLDRAKLSSANLRELSEAYVLLGYFEAGAALGKTLQDRDPTGTQGLKLAAWAKIEGKDYAGAVALAQEALRINPNDKDAAALLYSAKGRAASTGSAPAPVNSPPQSPASQEAPAPRAPLVFTPRPKGGVPSPSIPVPAETVNDSEGVVNRAAKWVNRKIDESTHAMMNRIDRAMGLQPGEEPLALKGASYGAVAGASLGAVGGGVVASGVCAPALVTGVPYGACVVAGGASGVLVGTPSVAYFGGLAAVKYQRVKTDFDRIFGANTADSSSKAE
ncbi:MAG: hypothetical protein ABL955_11080 [Elusimicrobiota bacterium]